MSTLKALRTRIESVRATKKITAAMKFVSAAKLRRAQEQLESCKIYHKELNEAWKGLLSSVDISDFPSWLLPKGHDKLIILIMADRGLCGSYNATLARHVRKLMEESKKEEGKIRILPLGFKALDFLKKDFQDDFLKVLFSDRENRPTLSDMLFNLNDFLYAHLQETPYASVKLVFMEFRSILRQELCEQELLFHDHDFVRGEVGYGPLLEPDAVALIQNIVPLYIKSSLRYAFYQGQTAEHAARMRAMDAATENANEMITKLRRTYNRTRQASITRELVEIISGANALAG